MVSLENTILSTPPQLRSRVRTQNKVLFETCIRGGISTERLFSCSDRRNGSTTLSMMYIDGKNAAHRFTTFYYTTHISFGMTKFYDFHV